MQSACGVVSSDLSVYRSDTKIRIRDRRLAACSLIAKLLALVYFFNYELMSNQSILLLGSCASAARVPRPHLA